MTFALRNEIEDKLKSYSTLVIKNPPESTSPSISFSSYATGRRTVKQMHYRPSLCGILDTGHPAVERHLVEVISLLEVDSVFVTLALYISTGLTVQGHNAQVFLESTAAGTPCHPCRGSYPFILKLLCQPLSDRGSYSASKKLFVSHP